MTYGHARDPRVEPARAREYAGVSNEETVGASKLALRVHHPVSLAVRHSARSPLMSAAKTRLRWIQARFLDLCQPSLELGVIDPFEPACLIVLTRSF